MYKDKLYKYMQSEYYNLNKQILSLKTVTMSFNEGMR